MARMANDEVIKLCKRIMLVQSEIFEIDNSGDSKSKQKTLKELKSLYDEIDSKLPDTVEIWTGLGQMQIYYDDELIFSEKL